MNYSDYLGLVWLSVVLDWISLSSEEHSKGFCRQELNDYQTCLEEASYKIRPNRTTIEISVKECFQRFGCTSPELIANDSSDEAAERRLQYSPFRKVDWSTFEQCRLEVNTAAREKIRACVKRQVKDFDPYVDEDVDEDGEQDGQIGQPPMVSSNTALKWTDSPDVCSDDVVTRAKVKQCVLQVFADQHPSGERFKALLNGYCDERTVCKSRLSPVCDTRLKQTHSLLCPCTLDEVISSNGDDLQEMFFNCTKVDADQRQSIQTSPQREYARSAFCYKRLDSCTWMWRRMVDEGTSSNDESMMERVPDGTDVTFYKNETDGQLGALLSKAFSMDEVRHLHKSLREFVSFNNASLQPSIISEQQEITRLLHSTDTNRTLQYLAEFINPLNKSIIPFNDSIGSLVVQLIGNNSQIQRLSELSASFFGYTLEDTNRTLGGNVEQLVALLEDSSDSQQLQIELYQFMNPRGNSTNGTDERDGMESLVNKLNQNDEQGHLIGFVHQFLSPHPSVTPQWYQYLYNHNSSNIDA